MIFIYLFNLIFLFILFTLMFPVPVRIIPLFQFVADIGWTNTVAGAALTMGGVWVVLNG